MDRVSFPVVWMKKIVFAILVAASFAFAFSGDNALQWLDSHDSNGDYGFAGGNAFALAALGDWNSNPSLQTQIAGKIEADLNDENSWSWAEADLPAAEWRALEKTGFAGNLNETRLKEKLLLFKWHNGGFKGLYECTENCSDSDWTKQKWEQVETATDTALALMALKQSGNLDDETRQGAVSFLYSLQQADGSFKQSFNSAETQLYSLGPDLVSTTALALMALQENGEGQSLQSINAIVFLKNSAGNCFGNSGKTYGPSLASIAFKNAGLDGFSSATANYVGLNQNQDGGFADPARSSTDSNALDTGVALSAAKNIAEGESSYCAPFSATLSFNTPIVKGNAQTVTVNAEGAVDSVSLVITNPSGSTSELNAEKKQDGVFQAVFTQTELKGNYSVLAMVKPKFGSVLNKGGVFEVVDISSTPTPAPSPTPTPTPIPVPEFKVVIATPYPTAFVPTPRPTISAPEATAQALPSAPPQQKEVETQSQPKETSPLTALAVSQPTPWFSFSLDEKNISFSASPIAFISLAAIAIIFSFYRRWKK